MTGRRYSRSAMPSSGGRRRPWFFFSSLLIHRFAARAYLAS
ncbi:hypothetical protein [Streptomyces syringium]